MSLILFGHHQPYAKAPKPRSGETIHLQAKRFGFFPRTFVWRGHEYHVETVERCWITGGRRSGGQLQRHYFQVRCPEGVFDLYQVIAHNTWHIARVERN